MLDLLREHEHEHDDTTRTRTTTGIAKNEENKMPGGTKGKYIDYEGGTQVQDSRWRKKSFPNPEFAHQTLTYCNP